MNPDSPLRVDTTQRISACPSCDLLALVPTIPDGCYPACGRCGAPLFKSYRNSINRVAALSFTGLMLYPPAMFLPLMTLSSLGIKEDGNVIDTFIGFYHNGFYLVSFIVLLTAVIFPFLKLFLAFVISSHLKMKRSHRRLASAFKLLQHLEEWGMVEVFLLGILVTLIKMYGIAEINYNVGFFCFTGLVLISIATSVNLDANLFWYRIAPNADLLSHPRLEQLTMQLREKPHSLTAVQAGLMRCRQCAQLVIRAEDDPDTPLPCPRCQSTTHSRISGSIAKTWALVLTSAVLFIPANMLPIMRVDFLGIPDRSTILDGILYFFKEGSFVVGLIIFTASILVPLFKIIGLIIILLTIRSKKKRFLRQKTWMFHCIESIGRWSMLDIFVVALLCVLVNFGIFTSIHTAPGATYFCLVVVMTMTAALVFDPRLLWDACDPLDSHQTT